MNFLHCHFPGGSCPWKLPRYSDPDQLNGMVGKVGMRIANGGRTEPMPVSGPDTFSLNEHNMITELDEKTKGICLYICSCSINIEDDGVDIQQCTAAWSTINAKECDAAAQIKDLTGGRGADAAIEAAGVPRTAKRCFGAVRIAGTVVFNGEQPAVELSPSEDFIRRDIRAVGSWFFHVGEFPRNAATLSGRTESGRYGDGCIFLLKTLPRPSQASRPEPPGKSS